MRLIAHLRSKPSHVKAQIAFVGALSITALIGLVWISTIPVRFKEVATTLEKTDVPQTAQLEYGFKALFDGMEEGSNDGMAAQNVEMQPAPEPIPQPTGALGGLTTNAAPKATSSEAGDDRGAGTVSSAPTTATSTASTTPPYERTILIGTTTKKSR